MDLEFFYAHSAPYVKLYSLEHILYLLVCFAAVFLFIRCRRSIALHRDTVGKVLLGILLFQQIFLLYGWYLLVSDVLLKEALPLELCRVSSLLTIVFLITKDKRFMDVIFYFSIYALCSLFYPKNVYHFLHVNGLSYMINHLMTVLIPIFGAIAYSWQPTWKAFRRAAVAFTVYLPIVIVVNHLTGGNYFYLVDRPFWNGMDARLFTALAYAVTIGGFALVTWLIQAILTRQKTPA